MAQGYRPCRAVLNAINPSLTAKKEDVNAQNAKFQKMTIGETMDKNKEISRQFYEEIINQGKLENLESIMDSNFQDHLAPQQPPGIKGFVDFLKMVSTAFPDIQVSVEDILAEGDRVAVRLSVSGTHNGVLMGNIQPTGKKVKWTGIDILRIENGKIKDRWSERNLLSMLKQIGTIK